MNAHNHKRMLTKMLVSLFIISTLMFCLVQLSPVFAQDAEDSGARFTGTITDEGVDADGDELYEYLRITVEVNVTVAGTYTVDAGGLYDAQNEYVVVSDNTTVTLGVGVHDVSVDLSGLDIQASELNIQTVASIYLYNATGDTIDSLFDQTLSAVYSYSQFEHPDIEIEFTEIKRDITLDQSGLVTVFNSYILTNLQYKASEVSVGIPEGAYDIQVRDEMGKLETSTKDNVMTITFRDAVETDEIETIYIEYRMPWDELVTKSGDDYTLQSTFFEEFNSTIGKLTVSITLPKGAELKSSTPTSSSITDDGLQETLSFSFSNVENSQDLSYSVNYKYLVFWGSFYPTMWVGIIAVVGSAVFLLFGKPKAMTTATVLVEPKDIKSFVDTYEQKETVRGELEDLEARLQKGKIPRRRYKVRRKMLEGRLTAISRNLSTISDSIRAGGSKYATMLRQIEVAETKLEGAQRDIDRIKARYSRGEVSKGAYGKLLEEYQSQIEEAEATIDGVLLRLRD